MAQTITVARARLSRGLPLWAAGRLCTCHVERNSGAFTNGSDLIYGSFFGYIRYLKFAS